MTPSADVVATLVTAGPPALLVAALVSVLWQAARGKIEIKPTLVLAGIAAGFFVLWIAAMPTLNKRRVYIMTSMSPKELSNLALNPVQYRLGKLDPSDLANHDFDLPDGRDPVMIQFDLQGLVNSYDANLKTIIDVARRDPQCFENASQGVAYSRVVARLADECPTALLTQVRRYD